MTGQDYIPKDIRKLYKIHDHHHAAAILANEFPVEFSDICEALRRFRISDLDIKVSGRKGAVPKKISSVLRPLGWREERLTAKLTVDEKTVTQDTHFVDYLKGRVAFDVDWDSKDQTFNRDPHAFLSFFEFGKISVGVLLTRSDAVGSYFTKCGIWRDGYGVERLMKARYGGSTMYMESPLLRLRAGRYKGCPVVVFGIANKAVETPKRR